MYHLRLIKGLSYYGVVEATRKRPDVFTEDKAVADAALASGYFKLLESPASPSCVFEVERLETMKVEELKRLAVDKGVDIGGLKTKAEYIEAIVAAGVVPGGEDE